VADRRRRRRIRIREDLAGHRHPLRRGHAPLPGGPEHLQPPAADPGPAPSRGPDRPPAARAGAPPAAAGARSAQHGRDHDRGPEHPAPDDVAAGLASVPERPPRRAIGRDAGHGDRVPGVRRALRGSQRRVLLLQLLRRVPRLQRPGVRTEVDVGTLVPTRTRASTTARSCRGTWAPGSSTVTPPRNSGSGPASRNGRSPRGNATSCCTASRPSGGSPFPRGGRGGRSVST
jgi:hypothetical protein